MSPRWCQVVSGGVRWCQVVSGGVIFVLCVCAHACACVCMRVCVPLASGLLYRGVLWCVVVCCGALWCCELPQ